MLHNIQTTGWSFSGGFYVYCTRMIFRFIRLTMSWMLNMCWRTKDKTTRFVHGTRDAWQTKSQDVNGWADSGGGRGLHGKVVGQQQKLVIGGGLVH